MNNDLYQQLMQKIDLLETRIAKLENNNKAIESTPKAVSRPQSKIQIEAMETIKKDLNQPPQNIKKESFLLGYIGAACVLLAAILLVKLSISSGWLTPLRQCLIASFVASCSILLPFLIKLKDFRYLSLTPAIGIVILHLTTYGAVFYHELINPQIGLYFISFISIVSLWLLNRFNETHYALLAVIGTYVGLFFFKQSFQSFYLIIVYLFVWDFVFTFFSIHNKKRIIITVSTYLSLSLVTFYALFSGKVSEGLYLSLFLVQLIQFGIFALGTVYYSIHNKEVLKEKESWALLPLILFFYGQEFYFLDRYSQNTATIFAIIFSVFLISIYYFSRKKLNNSDLASGQIIYTTVSIILAHSVFILSMNEIFRFITTLVLMALIFYNKEKLLSNKRFQGPLIISALLILYVYLSVLMNVSQLSSGIILLFGSIYGGVFLLTSYTQRSYSASKLILYLGQTQAVITLLRLKSFIDDAFISPLLIFYALITLLFARKNNDPDWANSSLVVIGFTLIHFFLNDFSRLEVTERIFSLFLTGGLIYISGYLYRKVKTLQ